MNTSRLNNTNAKKRNLFPRFGMFAWEHSRRQTSPNYSWHWILGSAVLLVFLNASIMLARQTPQRSQQVSQKLPTKVSTRLRAFSVPFNLNNTDGSFIEVQLYVSTDQGQSWSFHESQKTNGTHFEFLCDKDGEYWFALKSLDRNRQLWPDGRLTRPELRIVVDTVHPELDLRVESDPAGRVVCRWQAKDNDLSLESIKIEYQPTGGTNWYRVPAQRTRDISGKVYSDQLAWWPEVAERDLQVRLQIADKAGNVTQQTRRIVIPNVAPLRTNDSTVTRPGFTSNGWYPAKSKLPANSERPSSSAPVSIVAKPRTAPSTQTPPNNDRVASAEKSIAKSLANPPRSKPICKDGVCHIPPANPANLATSTQLGAEPASPRNAVVGSQPEFVAPPLPIVWTETDEAERLAALKPERDHSIRNVDHQPGIATGGTNWSEIDRQRNSKPIPQLRKNANEDKPKERIARQTTGPGHAPTRLPTQRRSITWPSHSKGVAPQPDAFQDEQITGGNSPGHGSRPMISHTPQRPVQTQRSETEQTIVDSFVREQGEMIISQSTAVGRGKSFAGQGRAGWQQVCPGKWTTTGARCNSIAWVKQNRRAVRE